jgi:hypothetical protein
MGEKIKKYLGGQNFFRLILIVFCIQALWFAVSIKGTVPPDEHYHFGLIQLYASEPITAGPFITHQPASSLWMGDVQRTPSVLYHYLMSFPLRLIDVFTHNVDIQLLAMRIVDIALSVCSLLAIRAIFKKLTPNAIISNLGIALFSLTGMFLWISSAVSYDNMATLAWLGFLWGLLCFQEEPSAKNLLKCLFFGISAALVKFDFVLVVAGTLVVYLAVNYNTLGNNTAKLVASIKKLPSEIVRNRVATAFAILTLMVAFMFIYRIGSNLVEYHAITPGCTSLHTSSECEQASSYQRTVDVNNAVREFKDRGGWRSLNFSMIGFLGSWVDQMYQRMYYYFGYITVTADPVSGIIFLLAIAFMIYLLAAKRGKAFDNKKQWLMLFVTLLFVAGLFYSNLNTYLSTGTQIGYQGRYLLPVLPFVYVFIASLGYKVIQQTRGKRRTILLTSAAVLVLGFWYETFPGLVFMKASNQSWYTPQTTSFNLHLKSVMTKTHLFHPFVLRTNR